MQPLRCRAQAVCALPRAPQVHLSGYFAPNDGLAAAAGNDSDDDDEYVGEGESDDEEDDEDEDGEDDGGMVRLDGGCAWRHVLVHVLVHTNWLISRPPRACT